MTIAAMVPAVRDTLGVTSSYDDQVIPAGIRRSIQFLLRTYNFPEALVKVNVPTLAGATTINLPASGVGIVAAVRLTQSGVVKRLRRTLVGELASAGPPQKYWIEGATIRLDGATTGAGSADIWYNDVDVTDADAWITSNYEDVVFVHSCMKLAPVLRKPEVAAAFQQEWAELIPTVAKYLNELNFNDMDIRMVPQVPAGDLGGAERYSK